MIYQVYVRSFQDSDGDGDGDLVGLASRLDFLAALGVDAVWLSPIYPSPMRDGGYDVADYLDVDPRFGRLSDLDSLISLATQKGIRIMLDLVPSHTSNEHPWFREDPGRYIWAGGEKPPNNWVGVFGGSAWSRAEPDGRWYLHTFFPEQPDLDWRQQRVRSDFAAICAFWVERGVAGFRLDAINCLMKDPLLRDDPLLDGAPPLPHRPEYGELDHCYSQNAPDIGVGLSALREGAGEEALLVGEIYLPSSELDAYLAQLDAGFSFELLHAEWNARDVRSAIERGLDSDGTGGRVAWVLSNHDSQRLRDRIGPSNLRAAALLHLTLPGVAVIYQGDEIGAGGGPGKTPAEDRAGRDQYRHPMVWDAESAVGGFTSGVPWLPAIPIAEGGVAQQEHAHRSLLSLYRKLIVTRRRLEGPLAFLDLADGLICFQRGADHFVAVNLASDTQPLARDGVVVCSTHEDEVPLGDQVPSTLSPGMGVIASLAGAHRGSSEHDR